MWTARSACAEEGGILGGGMEGQGAAFTGSSFLLSLHRLEIEVIAQHRALVWVIQLASLRKPAAPSRRRPPAPASAPCSSAGRL